MADNVAITAGAGTSIAADDISSVFYQRVKLAYGADGSAADWDGTQYLGFAGQKQKLVSANFQRPNDTTAYAAGDAVTNSTSAPSVITFDAVARANAGSGVIIAAVLVDGSNQTTKGQFELHLYDTTFTPDNDNSANTPTDGETETLIGVIEFKLPFVGDATSGASGNCVYPVGNLCIPFTTGASSDDIFGQLVVRNAYTPTAQEKFTVRLTVIQN